MILSFKDKETEKIFSGLVSKKLPNNIQLKARLKLKLINLAKSVTDLSIPPGNRLEALKGKRIGEWSIRINIQWRITFTPINGGTDYDNVAIEDYH